MNSELETYKFSLKTLANIIDSIEECNNNLNSDIKEDNKKILSDLRDNYIKLNNNINNYDSVKKEDDSMDIELVTKVLRDTIKNEWEKIEVFSNNNVQCDDNSSYVLNDMFKDLFIFIDRAVEQLNELDMQDTNDIIYTIINDKVNDEITELELIKDETNELLKINNKYIVDSNEFNDYKLFINNKIFKSKDMIYNLRLFRENNKNVLNNSSSYIISTLNNIIEKQIDELGSLFTNLDELTSLDEESYDNINEKIKDKNDYNNKVIYTIEELYNKNASSNEIMDRLLKIYDEEHPKEEYIEEYNEVIFDEKQKELDTKEYKDNFSKLNKSFWEARSQASSEGIKYPSSLYEKKVKEYQNNYLIDNYNISLETLERDIEEYKEKYASDIYMDKVYEDAIYELKEETLASIDEMCDESNGVSMLDLKALEILNDDLMNVVRDIGKVKEDENLYGFIDIEEYRKSYKLNNLIDKKEMIEQQINKIKNKIINS